MSPSRLCTFETFWICCGPPFFTLWLCCNPLCLAQRWTDTTRLAGTSCTLSVTSFDVISFKPLRRRSCWRAHGDPAATESAVNLSRSFRGRASLLPLWGIKAIQDAHWWSSNRNYQSCTATSCGITSNILMWPIQRDTIMTCERQGSKQPVTWIRLFLSGRSNFS